MKKNGKKFGSDFAKIDTHVIQPHEYDELPLITDEMLPRAVFKRNGKKIGRPKSAAPKVPMNFRFSSELSSAIKALGRGYNGRVEHILREALEQGRI